jgi:hypothetical protein
MIQVVKNFFSEIKLLWSFSTMPTLLVRVHTTEKFDAVERVQNHTRIKM